MRMLLIAQFPAGRVAESSVAFYKDRSGKKERQIMADVAILIGSASDVETVRPCMDVLRSLKIEYSVAVSSAHRTPMRTERIVVEAEAAGAKVFICAAGMAAHLAGAVAARTMRPVIGLPIASSTLGGIDSLLSTVQMPSGFPVATVAINGSRNAAWLAAQILALHDLDLWQRLLEAREDMAQAVEQASANLDHAAER